MFFQKRPLLFDQETIGQQLKNAREAKGLTIKSIAKKIIIKPEYLEALEKNNYHKLPKGVYVKNYLREYARFLGLDYQALDQQFSQEHDAVNNIQTNTFDRQIVAKKYLIAVPVVVRNAIIAVVALFCLIYLVILINKIFKAPNLVISQPANDIATSQRQLTVVGQTEPESYVTVNNQDVQVASDGNFKKEVYLEKGLNTIVVTSKKKNSRTAKVVRRILFQD